MKKKLSVFIVPDSGRIRQISLSRPLILSLLTIVLLCVCATLVFSVDFFSDRIEAHRVETLVRENQFLTTKLADIDVAISQLHGTLAALIDKEKAIRTIFELPDIDPQQRELGIGGPDLRTSDQELIPTREAAFKSEAELDRLVALSSFEKEQFNLIYEKLLQKKEELDHTPSIAPTQGYLIRGYGVKSDPFTGLRKLHTGLDISNRIGTPVRVTANGVIASAGYQTGLGNTIVVNHGNGIQTVYGHLSQLKVKVGQRVKRGEIIGLMGNTGYSTGPHLHYEVIKNGSSVNPAKYIYTAVGLN